MATLTPSRSGKLEPTPISSSSFLQQQQGVFPFDSETITGDALMANLSCPIAQRQGREPGSALTAAHLQHRRRYPPRQQQLGPQKWHEPTIGKRRSPNKNHSKNQRRDEHVRSTSTVGRCMAMDGSKQRLLRYLCLPRQQLAAAPSNEELLATIDKHEQIRGMPPHQI
ncbi:hypothetical protein ACLOJK_037010 [Asimina triloba]